MLSSERQVKVKFAPPVGLLALLEAFASIIIITFAFVFAEDFGWKGITGVFAAVVLSGFACHQLGSKQKKKTLRCHQQKDQISMRQPFALILSTFINFFLLLILSTFILLKERTKAEDFSIIICTSSLNEEMSSRELKLESSRESKSFLRVCATDESPTDVLIQTIIPVIICCLIFKAVHGFFLLKRDKASREKTVLQTGNEEFVQKERFVSNN